VVEVKIGVDISYVLKFCSIDVITIVPTRRSVSKMFYFLFVLLLFVLNGLVFMAFEELFFLIFSCIFSVHFAAFTRVAQVAYIMFTHS
jgi:hypothetical protein